MRFRLFFQNHSIYIIHSQLIEFHFNFQQIYVYVLHSLAIFHSKKNSSKIRLEIFSLYQQIMQILRPDYVLLYANSIIVPKYVKSSFIWLRIHLHLHLQIWTSIYWVLSTTTKKNISLNQWLPLYWSLNCTSYV